MNEIVARSLREDQDAFARSIVESGGAGLPANIEELIPILAFSKAKMEAFNALSDAAKKVQDQEELNRAALESGQRWGIVHLYGQKRLGEITREIPKAIRGGIGGGNKTPTSGDCKITVLERTGVDPRSASDAERIAAHPEILERVIEIAKASGDIPTKSAVLREIKAEKTRESEERYKKEVLDKKQAVSESPIEVQKYLSAMRSIVYQLPDNPPKDGWNDDTFAQAKAYADIIFKRMEAWK